MRRPGAADLDVVRHAHGVVLGPARSWRRARQAGVAGGQVSTALTRVDLDRPRSPAGGPECGVAYRMVDQDRTPGAASTTEPRAGVLPVVARSGLSV
jgi:hypothetical protein